MELGLWWWRPGRARSSPMRVPDVVKIEPRPCPQAALPTALRSRCRAPAVSGMVRKSGRSSRCGMGWMITSAPWVVVSPPQVVASATPKTDAVSAWVKTSLRRPGNRGSANVQALGLKGEGCFTEHYRRRTEFRNVRSFVTRLVGRAFATSQIPTKQSPVSVSTKNRASTGPARTRPFVRRAHWSPPSTRLWPFTCSHPAVELSPTTWPASEHADRPTRWAC